MRASLFFCAATLLLACGDGSPIAGAGGSGGATGGSSSGGLTTGTGSITGGTGSSTSGTTTTALSSSGGTSSGSSSSSSSSGASHSASSSSGASHSSSSSSSSSSSGSASSSSSSSGAAPAVCNFASGLNVAWVNFASDVPNPPIATFNTIFQNTKNAGGRVIRWWFHTNGTTTPGYQANGLAQPIPQSHIDGVKAILAAAHTNGVAINISLWSFDMLQSGQGGLTAGVIANNKSLLENDTNRQAYIDNYLTPLVNAVKGTPGLYSWEIFNEPEGMAANGWSTGARTTEAYIQKTVNWLAAAIHTADPSALVTNGAQTFDTCSTVGGKTNAYSDAALRAAGGKQNGTLNYYEVHYYASNGTSNSCFLNPASHWGLDKKLVMGEFFAQDTDGVSQNNTYTYLYTNGYNGAWAWSYDADQKWPTMQVPMQNLYTAHSADVGSCP